MIHSASFLATGSEIPLRPGSHPPVLCLRISSMTFSSASASACDVDEVAATAAGTSACGPAGAAGSRAGAGAGPAPAGYARAGGPALLLLAAAVLARNCLCRWVLARLLILRPCALRCDLGGRIWRLSFGAWPPDSFLEVSSWRAFFLWFAASLRALRLRSMASDGRVSADQYPVVIARLTRPTTGSSTGRSNARRLRGRIGSRRSFPGESFNRLGPSSI